MSAPKSSKVASAQLLPLSPLLPLAAVYGVQYFDQILLGLFVQPIKAELQISDTQIGLLTGAAFTVLYTVLGIPLARIADRWNRKWLIIICTIVFSVATAASGLAAGFLTLCLARMAVAIGEAGTLPAAVSMMADVYRPEKRRLVMSLHSCGSFVATAIGLLAVSALSLSVGWRGVFLIAGAGGIALTFVMIWAIKEPERQSEPTDGPPQNFRHDLKAILRKPTFVLLALALGLGTIASSAMINWFPAFLARSHNVPQSQIVLYLALAWGLAATSGGVLFGYISNWLHNRGGPLTLYLIACLLLTFSIAGSFVFNSEAVSTTVAMFMVTLFLMGGIRGPAFAVIQDIIPHNMRATASAVFMFSMYFIGVTLGPLVTGVISDFLGASEGSEALRYSLLMVVVASGFLSAICAVAAGIFYPTDRKLGVTA